METNTSRKLKFSEVMLLSQVLDQINIKPYIEYLTGNKIERLLKNSQLPMNDKLKIVTIDILSFIVQNLYKAKDSIYELINSYKNIKNAEDLDFEEVINIVIELFNNGLPNVLKTMINTDDLKKKLINH